MPPVPESPPGTREEAGPGVRRAGGTQGRATSYHMTHTPGSHINLCPSLSARPPDQLPLWGWESRPGQQTRKEKAPPSPSPASLRVPAPWSPRGTVWGESSVGSWGPQRTETPTRPTGSSLADLKASPDLLLRFLSSSS